MWRAFGAYGFRSWRERLSGIPQKRNEMMIKVIGLIFVILCMTMIVWTIIEYAFGTGFDQDKKLMDNIKKYDKKDDRNN